LCCHPVAVHIYTQTIHRTKQITTEQHKYKLMWKSAGRAPSLRVLPWPLLTTEEKARKNLSQGKKNLSQVKKNLSQTTVYVLPKNTHTHTLQNFHKHTHITKPSQTHTLQNNIKPPQYKLKQNAHRKSNTMGRKNST
jgi:hypothetical protein